MKTYTHTKTVIMTLNENEYMDLLTQDISHLINKIKNLPIDVIKEESWILQEIAEQINELANV